MDKNRIYNGYYLNDWGVNKIDAVYQLCCHPCDLCELSDEGDMLDEQLYHFVQTDWVFGIQDREVKLIIDVLNNVLLRNAHCLNSELKFKFWVSL